MIERLSEERPRLYGLLMMTVAALALGVLRLYAEHMGRISLALIFLASFCFTYGIQALVFATTPSTLRKERGTAGVLLAVTALGCFGIWRWVNSGF